MASLLVQSQPSAKELLGFLLPKCSCSFRYLTAAANDVTELFVGMQGEGTCEHSGLSTSVLAGHTLCSRSFCAHSAAEFFSRTMHIFLLPQCSRLFTL